MVLHVKYSVAGGGLTERGRGVVVGAPEAPLTISFSNVTSTSLRVSVTATADGSITARRFYVNGTKSGSDVAAPTLFKDITGLTPGTLYTFAVTQVNGTGESVAISAGQATAGGVSAPQWAGHSPGNLLMGYYAATSGQASWDNLSLLIAVAQPAFSYRLPRTGAASWDMSVFETQHLDMLSTCDSKGVLPWISTEVNGNDWAGLSNGAYDAQLDKIMEIAAQRRVDGKPPFIWSVSPQPAGKGDEAEWAAMQIYISNYVADVLDIMAFAPIGDGFLWTPGVSTYTARQTLQCPPELIATLKTNKHLFALDFFDDHPTYTGQTTLASNVPASPNTALERLTAFATWFRTRNGGAFGISQWGVLKGTAVTAFANYMKANDDLIHVANYYNGLASDWDYRLIPDSFADYNLSPMDFGGTAITEAKLTAYIAAMTPPAAQRLVLGTNRATSFSLGSWRPEAFRAYNQSASNYGIDTCNTKILCCSPTDVSDTASAAVAEINRLKARAAALGGGNGYTDLKVHYCTDNEADRHFGNYVDTGQPTVASWVAKQAAMGDAIRAAGGELWGNFTRFGIPTGRNDDFSDGWQYLDGLAVNFYHPGMEQTPIGNQAWDSYLDEYMDWVAGTGIKKISIWETGTRSDPARPTLRPNIMTSLVNLFQTHARARGLEPTVICYWDPNSGYPATNPLRDSSFGTDAPLTLNAWLAARPV